MYRSGTQRRRKLFLTATAWELSKKCKIQINHNIYKLSYEGINPHLQHVWNYRRVVKLGSCKIVDEIDLHIFTQNDIAGNMFRYIAHISE